MPSAATGDERLMNTAAEGVAERRTDMIIAGAALVVPGANSAAIKAGGAVADVARTANRACSFDASTFVLTEHGLRRIADVKPGDRVLARDEETGDNAYQRVLASFNEWHERTLTVEISTGDDSESIVTTDEHPFFVIDKGFVPAVQLRIGDVLSLADRQHAEVTVLRRNDVPQTAYNLTVEDDHTYFVGENGVWVHNSCRLPFFQTAKEAAKAATEMGFSKVAGKSRGQDVFRRGNQYITRDMDNHNGGAWKMADSIKDLGKKETRSGTYNEDLSKRIGD